MSDIEKIKPSKIGGQAVIEGIMMRCEDTYSVAVRKPDGDIEIDIKSIGTSNKKLRKIPFIRGIFAFVDSMVLGIKTLSYSAEFIEDDSNNKKKEDTEDKKQDKPEKKNEKLDKLIMALTIILSIGISVGAFMVFPYFVANYLLYQVLGIISLFWVPLFEAIVKMILFILYIWGISLMKDIRRTYMYHGAEHKCINCIESGLELNVNNVRKSTRFHKRCGTSFLFLVMIVSIAFFMVIRSDYMWLQYVLRILLVPLIAGTAYELIRIAGQSDNRFVKIISAPGLALQKLTTKEPDDSMIEVAIKAVEAVYDWKAYLIENGINITENE